MFHQRSGPRVSLGEVDRGGGAALVEDGPQSASSGRSEHAVLGRTEGATTYIMQVGVWKIMRKNLLSRPRAKECAKNTEVNLPA